MVPLVVVRIASPFVSCRSPAIESYAEDCHPKVATGIFLDVVDKVWRHVGYLQKPVVALTVEEKAAERTNIDVTVLHLSDDEDVVVAQ